MNLKGTVGVVDYGMGNLLSVANALETVGATVLICREPHQLGECDRIILPGVGAFGDCMTHLTEGKWLSALNELVQERRIPFLGICLGLQVLSQQGEEGGRHTGLGWVPASVQRLQAGELGLKVPHVGWESTRFDQNHPVFRGIPSGSDFYFVHSYHVQLNDPSWRLAHFDYSGPITAAIARGNVVATQFHPEKSSERGLRFLENFCQWDGTNG